MTDNLSGHSKPYPSRKSVYTTFQPLKLISLFFVFSSSFILFFSGCATTQHAENIKKAEAHNKLGVSYLNNDQINNAFIEFQKAIKFDPKNKETLNYLGYINAGFKKYDMAISYYKRAIAIDPEYSDAMNNLGLVYLDLKKWDEAIKYFRSALKNALYLTPEKAYSTMGYAYYKKGDYINAENSLKEALIRNPVFPLAMYYLGLVYIKLEKYEPAITVLKKAIGIVPAYYDAHWELAKIYLRLTKKSKALKHLRIVAEENENTARRRKALEHIRLLKY